MKNSIFILLGIPILAIFSCSEPADTKADIASIEQASKQIMNGLNTDDVDALMASLSDDHITMAPNEPAIADKGKMRAWHEARVKQFTFHGEFLTQDVQLAGDWAFEYFTAKNTLTPKTGGDPIQDILKGIWIWQRQQDGSWKLSRSIWNSDNPVRSDQ